MHLKKMVTRRLAISLKNNLYWLFVLLSFFLPDLASAQNEPCRGERRLLKIVEDPRVAGNIGNATARRLCIHLPATYDTQPQKRYPVVYMLPGLGGADASLFEAAGIHESADSLASQTGREAILVGIDTSTKLGGSYLVPSPLTGNFEQFVVQTVVGYIDTHFRTQKNAAMRALMGHSTGGFNAVSVGLRHGDVFQSIAAVAPDGLDLENWMTDGLFMKQWAVDWIRNDLNNPGVAQMKSYAGDWSPNPGVSGGLDWPINFDTGRLNSVWSKWKQNSPTRLLDNSQILANTKMFLNKRILISVGVRDEFGLYQPARSFSRKLSGLGVEHQFWATEDTHASNLKVRFANTYKALSFW